MKPKDKHPAKQIVALTTFLYLGILTLVAGNNLVSQISMQSDSMALVTMSAPTDYPFSHNSIPGFPEEKKISELSIEEVEENCNHDAINPPVFTFIALGDVNESFYADQSNQNPRAVNIPLYNLFHCWKHFLI